MRSNRGGGMILLGLTLILAAALLTGYNFWEQRRSEETVELTMNQLNEKVVRKETPSLQVQYWTSDGAVLPDKSEWEYPDYVLYPRMEMPEQTINGREYIGILEIPSLDLELPILSSWSYPALKIAPARYEGSAYLDNLIIAAHNYKSHFGQIHTLGQGERLTFTDIDGNVFVYEAVAVETLQPTAVEEMCSGDWDLTLFTCTLGGKFRVTVRCDRVEE